MSAAEKRTELAPHDVGGSFTGKEIDLSEKPKIWWERKIDAVLSLLCNKKIFNVSELRHNIESLGDQLYGELSYYEKWTISMSKGLLASKVITQVDLDRAFGSPPMTEEILFTVGDKVTVRQENFATRWVKPHLRTPGYLYGQTGHVERICGLFTNPETEAFKLETQQQPLYRVRFKQIDLWPDYKGSDADEIDVEIYQHWLVQPQQVEPTNESNVEINPDIPHHSHDHHHHHHDHDHDHDHVHEQRQEIEQRAVDNEGPPGSVERLAEILISVLLSKGIFTKEELRRMIEIRESYGVEMKGALVVLKAWTDEEFKKRLLSDANKALKELEISIDVTLIVVENTAQVHNVLVCTLCSCYPRQLLGMPPDWYKARSYRARVPREPRAVLKEFGTEISKDVQVRVHDSTADMRYMVLPQRPKNTESFTDEQLLSLINRDSLIGVTFATNPVDS